MSLHTINWRGSQSYAVGSAGRMAFNCSVDGVKLRVEQVVAMYKQFEMKRKPNDVKSTACGIKEVKALPKVEKPEVVEKTEPEKVVEIATPEIIVVEPVKQVEKPKKDYASMSIIDLRKEVKIAGKKATFRTPKAELIAILEG